PGHDTRDTSASCRRSDTGGACRPSGRRNFYYIIGGMRLRTVVLVAALSVSCGGGGLFRQYEYEEEMYLSLDGSATIYVNSSVAALNALRGTSFDADPSATIDRRVVRDYFTTPVTRVTRRPALSRRSNRR